MCGGTYAYLLELTWKYLRSSVTVFKRGEAVSSMTASLSKMSAEESENKVGGGKAGIPNIAQIPAPLRGVLWPNLDIEVTVLSRKQ